MSDSESLSTIEEELEYYGSLEGSELGDFWGSLARIIPFRDLMEDEFRESFDSFARAEVERIKQEFKVVVHEVTEKRTVHELEYVRDR